MLALYIKSGGSVAYIKSKIVAYDIGSLAKPQAIVNTR